MSNDTVIPYEEIPDHMVIWLDRYIGNHDEYIHLKKAFATNIDPTCPDTISLSGTGYYNLIHGEPNYISLNFEGGQSLLKAFTDIDRCIQCFEQNQDKHIIFITSGSMGKVAVPRILKRFPDIFTDPDTNEPYSSIYVYCHNIEYQMHWVNDYLRYLQIFNFDADLLVRMIRDVANYYVIRSKRLLAKDSPNNAAAMQRLTWAHELYQRYRKMEGVSLRRELDEVNKLLDEIDEKLRLSSEFDDEELHCEPCS